jgi:predicted alpha/beta hydrolase family esterase
MKTITSPHWTIVLHGDKFQLLPPVAWTVKLVRLIEDGTVSFGNSKEVCEVWRNRVLTALTKGGILREDGFHEPTIRACEAAGLLKVT